MEGVARYCVRLLPHNPAWEEEYLRVKQELCSCWRDNILDIQHVGSTAIPSICAKPILDVAVKLVSIQNMNQVPLTALGYDDCGPQYGNEHYRLFVLRGEGQCSLRHIHCYDQQEAGFQQLVGFRDYLNGHLAAAKEYEGLKRRLAEQYPDDRAAYTKEKEAFIQMIYEKLPGRDR